MLLQCLGSTFLPPSQVKPSWLGWLAGIFYMGNLTARLPAGRLVGRKADGRCYRTKFENYTATSQPQHRRIRCSPLGTYHDQSDFKNRQKDPLESRSPERKALKQFFHAISGNLPFSYFPKEAKGKPWYTGSRHRLCVVPSMEQKKKKTRKKMKEMHSPSVLMKTQFDHHCEGSERLGGRSQTTLTR